MSTKPTSKAVPPKTSTKKSVAPKAVVEKAPSKTNSKKEFKKSICKVSMREQLFVDAYLADPKLNGTNAAIAAGYAPSMARTYATRMLMKDSVLRLLEERRAEREKRVEITQDMVLKRWWDIANVDVNELIEYRRGPCPDCWQSGSKNQMPNADCLRCKGEGHGHAHLHDTRKLSSTAKYVYNGVKIGKDGLQVLMLDRDKALENVAKHLGMHIDRKEITGKDGAPLLSGLGHFYGATEEEVDE